MPRTLRLILLVSVLSLLALPASASDKGPDRVQFGSDIVIGPGEEVGEVSCFVCSIRIRGHVNGDVAAFLGSVTVEDQGEIGGDLAVFAGSLRLENAAKVGGDTAIFGGRLRRDPGASIGGSVATFSGPFWMLLIFVLPIAAFGLFVFFVIWLIRRLTRPALPIAAHP
ncbi:MAG TPA: polymer-forming cytoskeletal protein [Candidatus Solibacter sp.]|nr:polymer-forming cytoskeletal protein [Candidatus Solibacter sp.]